MGKTEITEVHSHYQELMKKVSAAYSEHDYRKAYDLATQAKLLAENYLEDELSSIECEKWRGIAYFGINQFVGHDILESLYFKIKNQLKIDSLINLQIAYAHSNSLIGKYAEAIKVYEEILKDLQDNEECIRCWVGMTYCYIYQIQDKDSAEIALAEKCIQKALKLAKIEGIHRLEMICQLDYACILNEKENFVQAIDLLEELIQDEYVRQEFYGHTLNELGIAMIYLDRLEKAYQILDEAQNWLNKKNSQKELTRNQYAFALYYKMLENYELAYKFADCALQNDQRISILKLLMEVSQKQFEKAKKNGNESEYVFYRSAYDRYKLQLERRKKAF